MWRLRMGIPLRKRKLPRRTNGDEAPSTTENRGVASSILALAMLFPCKITTFGSAWRLESSSRRPRGVHDVSGGPDLRPLCRGVKDLGSLSSARVLPANAALASAPATFHRRADVHRAVRRTHRSWRQ